MPSHEKDITLPSEFPTDSITQQAAGFIVRLTADDESERLAARAEFDTWKRADPRHARAAERLEGFLAQMQSVRDVADQSIRPARAALDAARSLNRKRRRRIKRLGSALVIAAALIVPVSLALRAYPPSYLMADVRTATGAWESITLPDGTRVTLDSASAVNLHFSKTQRVLELVQGDVMVQVAHDPARSFTVQTPDGSIRALGTHFVVSREPAATVLSMLQSRVSVHLAARPAVDSTDDVIVSAAQRVRITTGSIGPLEKIDVRGIEDAWKFHQLVVRGKPLADVLDALGRYRRSYMQYDRAALEGITVSAVLPLDDTDRALQLLSASFPGLRITILTPFIVVVDASSLKQGGVSEP